MIFYKSVSAGNDFIHLDADELPRSGADKGDIARRLCARNRGAGADGVVFYRIRERAVDFEIFNRDGSEAELSGNGMAGLAALMFYLGKFQEQLLLHTRSGPKNQRLLSRAENEFRLEIEIGAADFNNRRFFPFLEQERASYDYRDITFYPVSVGNPHAVVLLEEEVPEEKMKALGDCLESADIFPQRTNVEFVLPEKSSEKDCRVFFYERGVGPTLASATGSAAVFAILRQLRAIKRDNLTIHTGLESIKISGNREIYVENFTKIVYKGIFLDFPK